MKKYIFNFLTIVALLLLFSSCGATKGGCGLTSDATQIQQVPTSQTHVVATLD